MKIQTTQFGEIEFGQEKVITIEDGLFGFENLKKYLLLKFDDELFYWLNSIDEPEIAFPLFGMEVLEDNYPKEENHESFGVVTLNSDPAKITINMKAPLYINQDTKTGFQKILDKEKYSVNYNLFVA